ESVPRGLQPSGAVYPAPNPSIDATGCSRRLVSVLVPYDSISVFQANWACHRVKRSGAGRNGRSEGTKVQKFPAKRPDSGKLYAMKSKERIPVTVLTGFLGAG